MVDPAVNCDHEGAAMMGQYSVPGRYDLAMMVEFEDNEAVARLSLGIGLRAGLHVETLPAAPICVLGADSQF